MSEVASVVRETTVTGARARGDSGIEASGIEASGIEGSGVVASGVGAGGCGERGIGIRGIGSGTVVSGVGVGGCGERGIGTGGVSGSEISGSGFGDGDSVTGESVSGDSMSGASGIWAYAVAERMVPRWFAGMTGVGGGAIRTVGKGGLVAAVSEVSMAEYGEQALRRRLEDLDWLEAAARGHHRVIEAVARRQPVVPLRLATVYRSRAGVASLLSEQQETFRNALGRVTARSEWGVKIYAAPPEQAGQPETGPDAGPGAAYLRRRQHQVSAAHEARRAAGSDAGQAHAALRPLAVACVRRPPQDPNLTRRAEQMLLNVAYLVDDSQQERFTAEVDGLATRLPAIRVELTGPWPPYSFAVTDEEPPG